MADKSARNAPGIMGAGAIIGAALLWCGAALGQTQGDAVASQAGGHTVTVAVDNVRSDAGSIIASLCGNPETPYCLDYRAQAPADPAGAELVFSGVAPGRYLLAAFHDENGDGRTQIPPEGYAYGNGAGFPPAFEDASIQVDGDVRTGLTLTYLAGGAAAGMAPVGSQGAPAPDGVTRTDLREDGLYGEFYAPEDAAGPLPGLILIGGSEGGIDAISAMAAPFAEAGYAALAIAYWGEQGLPQTLEEIPLEYFDRAAAWLAARPEVDAGAIGAAGWSRGAEAALLLAARNPRIRAVAALAPSGVVWQGLDFADPMNMGPAWTAQGQALPFVTPDAAFYSPGGAMTPMFLGAMDEADARPETAIPVEAINGPVLLISGDDDQMWPSAMMAERIEARLAAAEFPHRVENWVYPGAGHAVFVGPAEGLMARTVGAPSPMLGGSEAANRAAWEDNWPRTLDFFDAALKDGE